MDEGLACPCSEVVRLICCGLPALPLCEYIEMYTSEMWLPTLWLTDVRWQRPRQWDLTWADSSYVTAERQQATLFFFETLSSLCAGFFFCFVLFPRLMTRVIQVSEAMIYCQMPCIYVIAEPEFSLPVLIVRHALLPKGSNNTNLLHAQSLSASLLLSLSLFSPPRCPLRQLGLTLSALVCGCCMRFPIKVPCLWNTGDKTISAPTNFRVWALQQQSCKQRRGLQVKLTLLQLPDVRSQKHTEWLKFIISKVVTFNFPSSGLGLGVRVNIQFLNIYL